MLIPNICILITLLAVPPYFLTKLCFSSHRNQRCAYPVMVALLPFLLCVGFTYLNIPITRVYLLAAHIVVLLLAVTLFLLIRKPIPFLHIEKGAPLFLLFFVALVIFPYTRFTGIDTYKWQDLATAIRLESSIPWLIHPLGLFGFLPRSYPSLQPILLATIQTVGNLGVEGGFRVLSLLVLTIAFTTSRCWFATMLPDKYSDLAALLYVLSPVFVRYTHWATGRGLFMAILPALLYLLSARNGVTETPQDRLDRWLRYCSITVLCAMLLLSHKAAWIALPLLFAAQIFHWAIPQHWLTKTYLLVPMFLLGVLISPRVALPGIAGNALGATWLIVSRFIWLFPIALVGWISGLTTVTKNAPYAKAMLLFCIPLALDPYMYGALLATPFIVAFAVSAVYVWSARLRTAQKGLMWGFLLGVSLAAAVMVVVARSRMAATADVKDAAMHLNHHDPYGPFQIHAPSPERTRIQAYLTGCPRFTFSGNPKLVMRVPSPPWRAHRPSRDSVSAWTAWLRNIFRVEGLHVQWYGDVQRSYHFSIDGRGDIPARARLLYENATVRIYQE